MSALPSLEDILADVAAGQMLIPAAQDLVGEHIKLAVQQGRTRDVFAAAALEGFLAAGVKPPSKDALAQECFVWADCMITCGGAS